MIDINVLEDTMRSRVRQREDGLFFHTLIADGDITYGYTKHGKAYLIDTADAEKVRRHSWGFKGRGYVTANVKNKERYLHNFLLENYETGLYVDHINRDKTDNRRSNMRICSLQQNAFNQALPKTNTSGLKGVQKNKSQKWSMTIGFCQHVIRVNGFSSPYQAASAYDFAAKILFGDFCWQNAGNIAGVPDNPDAIYIPVLLYKINRVISEIKWHDKSLLDETKTRLSLYMHEYGIDKSLTQHNYRERTGTGISGYKGVVPDQKRSDFWAVRISFNQKKLYMGAYSSLGIAAAVYDFCTEILLGEKAWLNKDHKPGVAELSIETQSILLSKLKKFLFTKGDVGNHARDEMAMQRLSTMEQELSVCNYSVA